MITISVWRLTVNSDWWCQIAKRAAELIEQAREGRLKTQDLTGGTISISNIGVLGGTVATPVINHPEAAIVALGKMQRLPRFDENDNVHAVNIMHVSWSGDHRIIDGATMVKFNNLWKSYIALIRNDTSCRIMNKARLERVYFCLTPVTR